MMVVTRVVAAKTNETTGAALFAVGSTGLGDGLGVTEGDCRVGPGSRPELLGRWRSLEGGSVRQRLDWKVKRSVWSLLSLKCL